MDNIKNNYFIIQSNEKLEKRGTIEVKKNSQSYVFGFVKFLDNINFKNGDFDDKVLDYIEESI